MKTKYNQKKLISFILIAGTLLAPAIFVSAQTDSSANPTNSAISENETAALRDLSQLTGQQITSVIQAKQICDLEKFLADCADIGKKNNLYEPEEIKQVNSVLNELKGKIVEDLKNCADENCLFKVANQLAQNIGKSNPGLAKQIDLTAKAVENKKEMVTAAREAGINFGDCQTMDPDTASIELLRACAKLAKDNRVQKYISADKKQLVETANSTVELREALTRGDYQCGDGTLESCGNFCLKPATETKEKGITAIPPVCRAIANKFFGSDGIKQLETNYSQVNQAIDFYQKKNENTTFVTPDGKVLFNPGKIGLYLEAEAKNGNVEAIEKGTNFLVAQGLISPAEKEFALKMTQTAKEQGGIPDFNACLKNPQSCAKFIPEKERGQLEIREKINNLMIAEMNKEDVSDPKLCEDSRYNEKCLRASQRALPQLETLAANSPEAKIMVQGIKTQIEFGQNGLKAQDRAKKESEKFGGKFIIGNKELQSFEEMDNYCRANSQECLAEAARKGFIEKDFASIKFGKIYENQFTAPGSNQQFFQPADNQTTGFPFSTPTNFPQYQPQNQTGFPVNQPNAFATPGSNFGATSNINKEEALKLFRAWLDNPQGQPPIPYFNNPQPQYPGAFPGYQQPSTPYPYNSPYPQQTACSQAFPQQPCPFGQYRQASVGPDNCPSYGECVSAPVYHPPIQTHPAPCPALPTVDSCPTGQTKEITFSSPECGTFYGCKNINIPTTCANNQYWNGTACVSSTTTSQTCPSGQYWFTPSTGSGYCKANETTTTSCTSEQYWNGTACVTSTTTNSNWVSRLWTFRDGLTETSYILNRTDQEYSNFISGIKAQCYLINKSQFFWKPNAGNSAPENWQNFGIPDCQGTTTQTACASNQYWNGSACVDSSSTSCASGQYWNGTACVSSTTTSQTCPSGQYWFTPSTGSGYCKANEIAGCGENLISLLGSGCHMMGDTYFNGPMTMYVLPNTNNVVKDCSTAYINNCPTTTTSQTCPSGQYWFTPSTGSGYCKANETTTTYCASGQYWNGTSCVTSPSASCTGSQYWNGSACVDSSSTSCASGQYWDGFTNACVNNPSTSCSSGQYWNGTACVDSTTTACTGSQYWNGSACVDSPSSSCTSGQYWNGTACVTGSISLQNQLAQIAAILRKLFDLSNLLR